MSADKLKVSQKKTYYVTTWYNEETEEWDSQVTIEGQLIPFDTGVICPDESTAIIKAMGAPAQPAPELTSSPEPATPATLPAPVEHDNALVPMSVVQPQPSGPSMVPAGPAISGAVLKQPATV